MFLIAQLHNTILTICLIALLVIFLGLLMKKFRQPYIIAYMLIGIILGRQGIQVFENPNTIEILGEIGIIVLLFFIGMEISLPKFLRRWKLALIGTLLQITLSVMITLALGYFMAWDPIRSIILGFIISLSSSAIIIKMLQDKGLIKTGIGNNVLIILLTQDILIVPLIIITGFLSGQPEDLALILLKLAGGVFVILTLVYIYVKKEIALPFAESIKDDHEMQVFTALFFCFGGAMITELFGLSAALGAFIGGMVIHTAKSTRWIFNAMHSFRIFFVGLFFVSIGLQIELEFIIDNIWRILLVIAAVYITNHLLNSLILKVFASSWKEAIVGGALLAQIGELSFLINSVAYHNGIFDHTSYQFAVTIISLTLFISPFWITGTEKIIGKLGPHLDSN